MNATAKTAQQAATLYAFIEHAEVAEDNGDTIALAVTLSKIHKIAPALYGTPVDQLFAAAGDIMATRMDKAREADAQAERTAACERRVLANLVAGRPGW